MFRLFEWLTYGCASVFIAGVLFGETSEPAKAKTARRDIGQRWGAGGSWCTQALAIMRLGNRLGNNSKPIRWFDFSRFLLSVYSYRRCSSYVPPSEALCVRALGSTHALQTPVGTALAPLSWSRTDTPPMNFKLVPILICLSSNVVRFLVKVMSVIKVYMTLCRTTECRAGLICVCFTQGLSAMLSLCCKIAWSGGSERGVSPTAEYWLIELETFIIFTIACFDCHSTISNEASLWHWWTAWMRTLVSRPTFPWW